MFGAEIEPSWDDMLSCFYNACMDVEELDALKGAPLIMLLEEKAPFILWRATHPEIIDNEDFGSGEKAAILSKRLGSLMHDLGVAGFLQLPVDPTVLDEEGKYALYL